MSQSLEELFKAHPIIASVKDDRGLKDALASHCSIVFVLYGSMLTIPNIVHRLKASGRIVFVDVDLIEGLSTNDVVVKYLRSMTACDGVLSVKSSIIRAAERERVPSVHRFFLTDSMSYHNATKQLKLSHPDAIEILPGCVPRVISWLLPETTVPIIAGGLVCDRDDMKAAFGAGATAVATSNPEIWAMTPAVQTTTAAV
jgi:glycerol uptake operon antiterminator